MGKPMFPGEDYAAGVVVDLLPNRRCSVRLDSGRVVVGCIPFFDSRFNESRTIPLPDTR